MRINRVAGTLAIPTLGLLAFANAEPVRDEARDPVAWFKATTQTLVDALATGDKAVWDRVLDPHCIITTEDGAVLDKARFLNELRPLPPGFTGNIKVRDLTVRDVGTAAVVHYWLDESENVFGQELKTTYVETDVYQRGGEKSWTMLASQVTVVPRDLAPIQVDSSGWQSLLGDYRLGETATSRYRVFLRDGSLYGGNDIKTATRLIPLAPLVFFQQGSIHVMVFVQDKSGAVTEVRELHKYNEVRMQRVASALH